MEHGTHLSTTSIMTTKSPIATVTIDHKPTAKHGHGWQANNHDQR